jgi:type IV secretion system protein VirB4
MFPDLHFVTQPSVLLPIGLALVLAIALGGLVAMLVPKIADRIMPRPRETRLAEYLPFDRLRPDGRTIECKNGSLARLFAITGVDQNFLSREDAAALYKIRRQLIDALQDVPVTLRIYTTREPVDVPNESGFPNQLAQKIASIWNSNFERAYITRTVIMLTVKQGHGTQALDEAQTLIEAHLAKYGPVELTQNPDSSPSGDLTIGRFLGRLVSPVSKPAPSGFGDNLADALCADEVEFLSNGRIVFRSGDRVKYASVLGIRRLGDTTSTELSHHLAAINAECTIFQTVDVESKNRALITLTQNQRMMVSQSFSTDVVNQYDQAIAMIEGMDEDKSALVYFSETVFLYGDSEEELAAAEQEARQIFTHAGVTTTIEKGASQVSWFLQFPTFDVKPRVYRLMSFNVAELSTFDRPATGIPDCEWGAGPIARFMTGQNSVYQHQFHATAAPGAVGHGVVIAPTGAGKTVLLEFLSMMASRHPHLKQFIFDRFKGTYIYTTAMGGKYLSLNAEKMPKSIAGGLNPFQCEATEENIEFLKAWLQALADTNDPASIEQIANAVDIAFTAFDRNERSLARIFDGAFTAGTDVYEQLRKWVDPNQYGEMFNAEVDCIDLDDNWLTTFDMTSLFDDPNLAGATISYFMHRIRQTMRANRCPGLIVIDETEPLLRNEHFRNIFLVMLQEYRKLGGVVISVFQRPEALSAQNVSELIRQQCSTFYLYPNMGASERDYRELGLNEREISFILGDSQPARRVDRGLLVKRPQTRESVILDVDLKPLGRYLDIFSSRSADVDRVSDLQTQYPDSWLNNYIERDK